MSTEPIEPKRYERDIQDTFLIYLIGYALGGRGKNAVGFKNLSGTPEKLLGDFIASVDAVNILIEFKKDNKFVVSEEAKPLRMKLCKFIPDEKKKISKQCHFISYPDVGEDEGIFFCEYISKVCPLLGFEKHRPNFLCNQSQKEFCDNVFDQKIGALGSVFKKYIAYLSGLNEELSDTSSNNTSTYTYLHFNLMDRYFMTRSFSSFDQLMTYFREIGIDPDAPNQGIGPGNGPKPPGPSNTFGIYQKPRPPNNSGPGMRL